MKVRVAELREDYTVTIKGSEGWLHSIYESFAKGGTSVSSSQVSGKITLAPLPGDVVHVTGHISYEPKLDCSRCADQIPWPIHANIDIYFEDRPQNTEKREVNLHRQELDRYYYENGAIDIENLINEFIQVQLPMQVLRPTADNKNCLVCGDDLSTAKVYGEEGERNSPFAGLANRFS